MESASDADETGLVVPVPELDGFVRKWRPLVDASPPVGIPAHITLLYPFLGPPVDPAALARLEAVLADVESFEFQLSEVGWFGSEVCFVTVEPEDPFRDLTHRLVSAFDLQPYGGEIVDPKPHVTIGWRGANTAMNQVATAAEELLPRLAHAGEVWVMEGTMSPPHWSVAHRLGLGPST